MMQQARLIVLFLILPLVAFAGPYDGVRLKEMGRFHGISNSELIGYGLVVGLAGTGDSQRNKATIQSVANTLISFGVNVELADISARNVAAVMVTATLPAFAEKGDRVDVKVSSLGDARSLAGGVLFMAPLMGADEALYVIAQGQLTVGGFAFDSFDSVVQKNHPTVGAISNGGLVVKSRINQLLTDSGDLNFILNEPDFDNVAKIVTAIEQNLDLVEAIPIHAGKVNFALPADLSSAEIFGLVAKIEQVSISPDVKARVVINERTGTLVAGGDVYLSNVTISHGTLKLVIDTTYNVSQPSAFSTGDDVASVTVPQTTLDITETQAAAVTLPQGATVADLVSALKEINVTTRDIIVILQSVKRAGALYAELIVE